MGRAPCCEKVGLKRGRWTAEEDEILMKYIQANGEGSWRSLPKNAGLLRCGKSCRLRWINYLRADLKRGNISAEEEEMIIKLHSSLGNRWSLIAGQLPGRTDNEIKNYWNSHLSRRIHTFRRPISSINESLPRVILDLAKMNTGPIIIKRKGGRTSRASMKKNKKMPSSSSSSSNPKMMPPPEKTSSDDQGGGGAVTDKFSNQEKETLISGIEEQVEERESMVLDSYEEGGEERESLLITTSGHCQDSGGISEEERESLILSNPPLNEEEIESGFLLCPDLELPGLLCPVNGKSVGGMDTSGILKFGGDDHDHEMRENASLIINTSSSSNDQDAAGKISGDDDDDHHHHQNWQQYSSSCFDQDDWVHKNWDWNWEGVVEDHHHLNLWGDQREEEEMLSWLWESDHNDNGGGGDGGGEECEKQQALNAWLLS